MQAAFDQKSKKIMTITILLFLAIGLLGIIISIGNDYLIDHKSSMSVTSRSINAYFGALITAMALIITLTSNLYSPMLSRVFVSHPLTIIGISYIILTNLFITITHLTSPTHPWYTSISLIAFSMTMIAMFGTIPFLFLISRFVKPSYFVPLLGQYSLKHIEHFHSLTKSKRYQEKEVNRLFEMIDVINNMASTAIIRSDKRTLKVVIDELFEIHYQLIQLQKNENRDQSWRFNFEYFTTGLSDEGQYFLKKNKTWPEAYILSKVLENALGITEKDNEIIPYICRKITHSIDLATTKENENLIEIHLMVLNSLLNQSIETNNQTKFCSVLYYYRLNTELLIDRPNLRLFAIDNFLYYGTKALQKNELNAAKNFLFDLGKIMHYLAFESEDIACEVFDSKIRDVWSTFMQHPEQRENCLKSIVKVFWTLYSQNYNIITKKIRTEFLKDNIEHAKIIKQLTLKTTPLSKEFNENLVSPEFISGMAYNLAKDFLNEFKEL